MNVNVMELTPLLLKYWDNMRFNKLLFIFLIFILFFSINFVSASENISDDNYMQSVVDDEILIHENDGGDVVLSESSIEESNYQVIFVGQNDEDGNGSFENPFSNFKVASQNIDGKDNVMINVREGNYSIDSKVEFNVNNLIICPYNYEKVMISPLNDEGDYYFSCNSPLSNFTVSDITFDALLFNNFDYFQVWDKNFNQGLFKNCSFLNFANTNILGDNLNKGNISFNGCNFVNFYWIKYQHSKNLNEHYEYCTFLSDIAENLGDFIYINHLNMDKNWFGINELPSYVISNKVTNDDGFWINKDLINKFAVFKLFYNYLGSNSYEIIGKLTWNGTDDQDGMENFQPMTVTLVSEYGGEIASSVPLVNGTFKTTYKNSASNHKITATLHNEELPPLEFTTVNITCNPASVYYGDDQNITFNFTQPITANVTVTVSIQTYRTTNI